MATDNADDFAAAFEEAAVAADKDPVPSPGSDAPVAQEKDEPAEKKDEPAEKKDEPAEGTDEPAEETDEPADADAEKKAAEEKKAADAEAKRVAEIKERAKAEARAKLEAEQELAAQKAAEAEAAKQAAATVAFPELELTPAEKDAIEKLEKDWPEAKQAMDVILKHREHGMKKLITTTLQQVLEHVYKDIGVLRNSAVQTEEQRHFAALEKAHADLDDILPPGKEDSGPLKAWIDQQPSLYKGRLEQVYNEGTTAEMIELISTFKQATGKGAKEADKESAAEAEKAKKAAAMSAVPSKRTVVRTAQPDPNNFDAAFDEATANEKVR
jgi:hypothetical protein